MADKTAHEMFDEAPTADQMFAEEGAGGGGGHEEPLGGATGGPGGHEKLPTVPEPVRMGTPADAARTLANTMTFGAAPQVEGAMGAAAQAVTTNLQHKPTSPEELLAAYKAVRNMGEKQHAASERTAAGGVGTAAGFLLPHPLLPTPSPQAGVIERGLQGAAVGGPVGAINAAAQSKGDVTSGKLSDYSQLLDDAAQGYVGGLIGGGLAGGAMRTAESPTRQLAEEQALRAAGLRGGIKNSLRKDLGIENMTEARELGRKFLDEGLIPPIGSSEAVARRAEALEGQSGNAVGSTLAQADVSAQSKPNFPANAFSYSEGANAARAPILDPSKTTAVARAQAGKALQLADQIQAQGADTPGSFVGANRAKSDAWKAANFSADPDLSAVNYRKAVSGFRQNIEDQVARELGPEAAAGLAKANQRYGVAADALKLAENASTRDAAKQGITMGDILALIAGTTAGGATGHEVAGPGLAAASVLGKKAFDKYGHSTAARAADVIAKGLGSSSGGHLGGMSGASSADRLAPWSQLLGKPEEEQ